MRALIVAVALALVAFAYSASSGPLSKEDYAAAVVSAVGDSSIAPGAMNTGDLAADADALAELGESYGDLGEDLADLEPPPEIAAVHREMVDGLAAQATALRDGAEAVRRDDRGAYVTELERSSAAGARWTQAVQTLTAGGYGTAPAGY